MNETNIEVSLVTTTDSEMNYLTSQMSLNSKNERISSSSTSSAPTMSSLEHMHKNLSETFQAPRRSTVLKSQGSISFSSLLLTC